MLKLERQSGFLTTKEIDSSKIIWVKTIQAKIQDTPQFKDDAVKLILQLDEIHIIYIYKGRITGDYLIYIPSNTSMSEKLVEWATQWQRSDKDSGFQSYVSSQNA